MIRIGWICLLLGYAALAAEAQISLQNADSLTVFFPPKPLEKDPFPPAVIFFDHHLMVFPGDFTAHFFEKHDSGFCYISTIKFWEEKRDKIYWRQAFQFFAANQSLWGIGDNCLYRYSLSRPESPLGKINLLAPNAQYLVDCPFDQVVIYKIANDVYRFYQPTISLVRSRTLNPTNKDKESASAGAIFASFDLKLSDNPKTIDRQAFGKEMTKDTSAYANFHSTWFRMGNIATDGSQLFYGMHANGKIWCFDLKGQLIDSIDAKGQAMPNPCIQSPQAMTRSAIRDAVDSSGFYQDLMVLQNGKFIARQYQLPKDRSGSRSSYLQVIETATKKVWEVPVPNSLWNFESSVNQLFIVKEWDFSSGYVKIQFFDILSNGM